MNEHQGFQPDGQQSDQPSDQLWYCCTLASILFCAFFLLAQKLLTRAKPYLHLGYLVAKMWIRQLTLDALAFGCFGRPPNTFRGLETPADQIWQENSEMDSDENLMNKTMRAPMRTPLRSPTLQEN